MKLKQDYPQLVFFCPSQQNKSELVYSEYYGDPQVSRQFILKLHYIKSRITANTNFLAQIIYAWGKLKTHGK